ncbi:halocyanin domain-containing protein [Halonotius sp. GCM10025705]|uniref:halocyanin domain-containing protein n=1 Tax=Halonotius sp. GCM10025705 TaxID=3252678 RepID=UPI00360AA0DE
MTDTTHRRTILKLVGATASMTALAGCSGGGSSGGSDSGTDNSDSTESDSQFLDSEPEYEGWLDDVDNYDQTRDLTGEDTVTIAVGAGNDGIAFDPPAVAVSQDTTVVWEWTGEGGGHNVAAQDGSFESQTVTDGGHTFEQTVSETGLLKYLCTPHEALGMKGAIVVRG